LFFLLPLPQTFNRSLLSSQQKMTQLIYRSLEYTELPPKRALQKKGRQLLQEKNIKICQRLSLRCRRIARCGRNTRF